METTILGLGFRGNKLTLQRGNYAQIMENGTDNTMGSDMETGHIQGFHILR